MKDGQGFAKCTKTGTVMINSIIASRALLRDWAESLDKEDESLVSEASTWKNSNLVMLSSVNVIKQDNPQYESGDEHYVEIAQKVTQKPPKNPQGRGLGCDYKCFLLSCAIRVT